MPPPSLSPQEFEAELRRHGLSKTHYRLGGFTFWKSADGAFYGAIEDHVGFIHIEILMETLRACGIEFVPPEPGA